MPSSPQVGSDVTHWLYLLHEHSSLSSGLASPLWGCRVPSLPCLVLTPHSRSLPLWIPSHPALPLPSREGCSSLRAFFALRRLRPHAGLLLPGDALSTWLGFHPPRPGYHSVDALFILFIGALAHLPCSFPTEILSTPCTGCEFSMPGRIFEGIPSLPLWAKPPFWATLLRGWPSCPHTLGLSVSLHGAPFLTSPQAWSLTSLSCIVHLSSFCSGSDFSYQAKFPCCMYIMFSFLIFIFKLFYQLYLIDVPFFIHLQLCIFSINTLCIPV